MPPRAQSKPSKATASAAASSSKAAIIPSAPPAKVDDRQVSEAESEGLYDFTDDEDDQLNNSGDSEEDVPRGLPSNVEDEANALETPAPADANAEMTADDLVPQNQSAPESPDDDQETDSVSEQTEAAEKVKETTVDCVQMEVNAQIEAEMEYQSALGKRPRKARATGWRT